MKRTVFIASILSAGLLSACVNSPEQQRQVGCLGAGVAGALAGAAVGNQLGGGRGNDILTAGGAVAGGVAGNNAAGC